MTDPASKWGLPDWRDEAAYRAVASRCGENLSRWRWEFYRRRDDLRADFEAFAEIAHKMRTDSTGTTEEVPLPTASGFTTNPYRGEPYGYIGIPNPSISEQPDLVLQFISIEGSVPGFFPAALYKEGVPLEGDWQFAVVFDLDLPLESQLKATRAMLQKLILARGGSLLKNRFHVQKWPIYLRALDARECGASLSDIAKFLKSTAGTEQAARDILKQAGKLRDNFPNFLHSGQA